MNNTAIDITNIPIELKLILEILKVENNVIDIEGYLEEIDWELFIQLSLHHRVYPMLYSKLLSNVCSVIPKEIVETLAIKYRNNTFNMLHLSGIMDQLSRLFMENDVPSLFLKGPILAQNLYGDISLRTCSDLDILVPLDDLEKANKLLLNLGYVKDEYIKTLLNDWKWRHHHFTYFHPTKGTKIEIHWRLNPHPNKEPSFSELWERKRISTITSFPTHYLGQEDLFLYLIMHGARHGWSRLRWLEDINRMAKKGLDWNTLKKLFKKYQCTHIGGQSLILAAQILNLTLTVEMKSLIKGSRPKKLANGAIFYLERMVNLHSEPVPREIAKYHSNHLFSLLTFQQKLIHWISMMHPYYTDVETFPLPKKLHYLYFPLRPFLFVWRKTKKQALS
jgi:hypothetical protein